MIVHVKHPGRTFSQGTAAHAVLQSYGGLTPERLRDAQKLWNSRGRRAKRRTFLQLFLDPDARAGQPVDMLSQVNWLHPYQIFWLQSCQMETWICPAGACTSLAQRQSGAGKRDGWQGEGVGESSNDHCLYQRPVD